MTRRSRFLGITAALVGAVGIVRAQEPGQASEGVKAGNYRIHHSVETGYRWTSFDGSRDVYDTFVNLHRGPRILEQSFDVRSIERKGSLFDTLSFRAFGHNGEPNTAGRLRISKDLRYNFNGTFRRDRKFFNYDLLANPLNPRESDPSVPITFSPHHFNTTRRLTDLNLTVLPQSPIRVRLGYSRNQHEGASFSTARAGTETLVLDPWRADLNSYRLGVDFRALARTSFSYDQFLHFYKQDNYWTTAFRDFQLAGGTPVDLGLAFNTPANQPCRAPVLDRTTQPQTANPVCNAFLDYNRFAPSRSRYWTEQVSFHSRSIPSLDLSGRFSYSSARNEVREVRELFRGLSTRSQQREAELAGPSSARRVSSTGDFGATWHVTDIFRVSNTFRFDHFRIPGLTQFDERSLFGTSLLQAPVVFDPTRCLPPFTGPGCPPHTTSSPADVIATLYDRFLGQESFFNLLELQYDFTTRTGARLGHRYGRRAIVLRALEETDLLFYPTLPNRGACAGKPLASDGTCSTTARAASSEREEIHEHSLVFGAWSRPVDTLRLSFDLELMTADHAFTRISPRRLQRYRFRAHHSPRPWLNLSGHVNILERRNNVPEVNHLQHSRSYNLNAFVARGERFALDLSYSLEDIFSRTNICFVGTLQPPGTSPCPTAAVLLQQISRYDNLVHDGLFGVVFRPTRRLSTTLGYSIISTSGGTLVLNPNQPPASLQFNYHRPYASIAYDLNRSWTWGATWGHYGYNEKGEAGPTAPRDFRGNLGTITLRHAF